MRTGPALTGGANLREDLMYAILLTFDDGRLPHAIGPFQNPTIANDHARNCYGIGAVHVIRIEPAPEDACSKSA